MRRLLPALTVVLLLTAACGSDGGDVTEPLPDGPIPVEPDGGIGDGAGPLPGAPGGGPIPVEGDGGIGGDPGDLSSAPPFGVSSEVASAVVEPTSFCWSPPGGEGGMCADGFAQPENHVLAVDEQLVVTYPMGDMVFEVGPAFEGGDGGVFVPPDTTLTFEMEAEGIWLVSTADLEPGEYALFLSWSGEQGDSSAVLTLRVS